MAGRRERGTACLQSRYVMRTLLDYINIFFVLRPPPPPVSFLMGRPLKIQKKKGLVIFNSLKQRN